MSPTWAVVVVVGVAVVAALLFLRRAGGEAAGDVAVLSQLRQAGSDLKKPHEIEFFLYFPSEASAHKVGGTLSQRGFRVEVKSGTSDKPEWLVLAVRSMVPEVFELVRLRGQFTELANSERGTYDGWGTPVVK
jgi:hypothetical protein